VTISIDNERPPTDCPRGHALTSGHVIVGWSPCQCPPCLERGHGLRGHRTYQCRDCQEDGGWTTVCYQPYHVPSPDSVVRWP
jgi:hypothetical protein